MKTVRWQLFLWLFICWCSPWEAQAKKHRNNPTPAPLATPSAEPPPLPAESTPHIDPTLPPSVSLQPFLDTHLREILTPLGVSAFAQPELISSLKASYADGMAAGPASHRGAFQLAEAVCDAMTGAIIERQNAVAALRGALATRSSEADQPKGGGEAVNAARDKDNFFIDSAKNTWIQRATVLSQNITALYLRERTVERQIGPWTPPPAPTAAPTPVPAAVATPSVSSASVPAAPAPYSGSDPIIGDWLVDGRAPITPSRAHVMARGATPARLAGAGTTSCIGRRRKIGSITSSWPLTIEPWPARRGTANRSPTLVSRIAAERSDSTAGWLCDQLAG